MAHWAPHTQNHPFGFNMRKISSAFFGFQVFLQQESIVTLVRGGAYGEMRHIVKQDLTVFNGSYFRNEGETK